MKKTVFLVVILFVVLAALILVIGPCVYYGFFDKPGSGPDMPNVDKATHSFYIENTGGLLLASDWNQHGQEVGSRLFILHGYWEMRGNKFKLVEGDIILDEAIFGEITVKERVAK